MKKTLTLLFLAIAICSFCILNNSLFVLPKGWPKPAYDFATNKLTTAQVNLGKALFYEPLLSSDTTISCSSCHLSYTAFAHTDHQLSHGIKNKIGTRNAPALFNLAWANMFMWDGAIHHLDVQALAPISNPDEMGESLANVVRKLNSSKHYKQLFYKAFNDSVPTGERTLKAISQFLLTLVSANSKYDKVMRKEKGFVFTEYETKGYALFKTHCGSCHTEPLFTNNNFENNGLSPDNFLNDMGRIKITNNSADSLKFKVPSLRNIEVTYPYMHDGRFANLPMVLFHYTNGIHISKTLSAKLIKPIILTEEDKNNLIAFLKTLTDEDFLHNPKFLPIE